MNSKRDNRIHTMMYNVEDGKRFFALLGSVTLILRAQWLASTTKRVALWILVAIVGMQNSLGGRSALLTWHALLTLDGRIIFSLSPSSLRSSHCVPAWDQWAEDSSPAALESAGYLLIICRLQTLFRTESKVYDCNKKVER